MRMSESMIKYYLDTITVGYFNEHDLPPDNLGDYENLVNTIKSKATKHGDLEYLHVALAWLLTNKEVDLESFNGGRYPFDADEMREIISYVYVYLFQDRETPDIQVLESVQLVNVSLEEWWKEA